MKYRNPWDYGWRNFVMWVTLLSLVSAGIYFLKIRPKLEVCRVYYTELGRFDCLMSSYGLPTRSSK
jgi:hypothetical protein